MSEGSFYFFLKEEYNQRKRQLGAVQPLVVPVGNTPAPGFRLRAISNI
jgi:hypothetical protein